MTHHLLYALAALVLANAGHSETLDELLASRALERMSHPIAAEFLAAEGARYVTDEQRARATAQLKISLGQQTSPMVLQMRGAATAMNSPAMQRMREQAMPPGRALAGDLLRSQLGIQGVQEQQQFDPDAMEREMQEAMTGAWVRAVGAARAVSALGDAEAAARFYVSCLQMLDAEWAPGACLEDILSLGQRRAEVLLTWMLENAVAASAGAQNLDFGDAFDDDDDTQQLVDPSVAQLRNAALEGLGALVGGGRLPADAKERAFANLLRYSTGRENEPYLLGVAEGLSRSRDPRAVAPLERLADMRDLPDVQQAALRGLAVAFKDEKAIKKLRRDLDDKNLHTQLRAAQALYETADEKAFEWAADTITQRRVADSEEPDIRAQVVRDLVDLGGEASRAALRSVLNDGARNDWLEAYVAIALLELGDTTMLPRVEAAIAFEDWDFDPRGVRSVWRAIKPFVQFALSTAMSGGLGAMSSADQLRQVSSLIGNAVTGERARQLRKLDRREALTAKLRWQAADAIAAAQPANSLRLLAPLLQDETPGVQASAALALARVEDVATLPLIAEAYERALGEDGAALGHGPELRATLVRSAVLRAPTSDTTRALLAKAANDPDTGVRFIALASSHGARP